MWPIVFETSFGGWLEPPWRLDSYSSFIILGYVVGMALAMRQMRREQENPRDIIDLGFWALLSGLVGARLGFILANLGSYAENPAQLLRFWEGGLVWYGGFILATVTIVIYCRWVGVSPAKVGDICITYMAFSTGVGRLGCFAAGCCYGKLAPHGWGLSFPAGSPAHLDHLNRWLVSAGDRSLPVYPTQLFESAAEFLLFALLVWMSRRKRFDGQLILTWLLGYASARALIEVFRGDAYRGIWLWGLSTSQWVSIGVATFSVSWIAWRLWRAPRSQIATDEDRSDR